MAKPKIINEIRERLIEENIYTPKDAMTLMMLENTYSMYVQAYHDVKKEGQTLIITDSNGRQKKVANPSFRNFAELQKELFKLCESLFLTPKSRKTNSKEIAVKEDLFDKMMNEVLNVEKE